MQLLAKNNDHMVDNKVNLTKMPEDLSDIDFFLTIIHYIWNHKQKYISNCLYLLNIKVVF